MQFLGVKKQILRVFLCILAMIIVYPAYANPSLQDRSDTSNMNPSVARSALFHLDGISEDVARGDLLECMTASSDALSLYSRASSADYGLVGSLIGGLLGSAKTNRLRNASLQQCMVLRGYRLFLVDEQVWLQILRVNDALQLKTGKEQSAIVDALAKFAATPLPDDAVFRS